MESNGKYSIILKESNQKMRAEAIEILENSEFVDKYYICDTDEDALKKVSQVHPDIVVYGLIPLKSYIEGIKKQIYIELCKDQLSSDSVKKK